MKEPYPFDAGVELYTNLSLVFHLKTRLSSGRNKEEFSVTLP